VAERAVYGKRSFFYCRENGIDSAQLSTDPTLVDEDDEVAVYGQEQELGGDS
jgi:hypothetical protein